MYGKFFSSTFTGSMLGAGADVFAVWGYVIANTVASQVELNPQLLAPMIGMTPEAAQLAIDFLCAPDPFSRSKVEDGRRLIREGQFAYRVPNSETYRAVRNEDDRREYNRQKQAEHRLKTRSRKSKRVKARVNDTSDVKASVIDCQAMSTMSAQAEAETEAEEESTSPVVSNGKKSWPDEGAGLWSEKVGPISPARFGRGFKPVVDKYGWPVAKNALLTYVEMMEGKTRKVEWLADDAVRWVTLAKMPCVDPETRELTEKGRMAYYG